MASRIASLLLGGRYTRSPVSALSRLGWRRQLATVSASAIKSSKPPPIQDAAMTDLTRSSGTTTLPSSWFGRNEKLASLEKRAIWSKSWIMTAVISEFSKAGDFKVVEMGDKSIFLVIGRDSVLRGFHNVCRHRAYPLRTQPSGCSGVISCGYHAWTWDLSGNLIKAPQFDGVEEFDKAKQSLYPVHVHVTRSGCVFVNLEASIIPSVSFDDFFPGLEELLPANLKNFELRKTLDVEIQSNWKTRIDGFQECYHCQVAHPSFARTFDLKNYAVVNQTNYSQHIANPAADVPDAYGNSDALFLYMWPASAINVFGNGLWQWSLTTPLDGGRCRVQKQYYVDPTLSDTEKDAFVDSFYQVFAEDVDLCEKTQKSLDAGVYQRGVLHPHHESGVISYQDRTKKVVMEHAALEERLGREVDPASPVDQSGITETPEDTLCTRLQQREW